MGTRFVSVPDWETAAALISEGLLWFEGPNVGRVLLPRADRSPTNPEHWCDDMRWYCTQLED